MPRGARTGQTLKLLAINKRRDQHFDMVHPKSEIDELELASLGNALDRQNKLR